MGTPLYFRPVKIRLAVAQVYTFFTDTYQKKTVDFGNEHWNDFWCDVSDIYEAERMWDMSDEDIMQWYQKAIRLGITYEDRKISADTVRNFVAMWQRKGWTSAEQKKAGHQRAALKWGVKAVAVAGLFMGIQLPMD